MCLAGSREMQIYELVRQAADSWNLPLLQVARFQEWWDSGKNSEIAQIISKEYQRAPQVIPLQVSEHRFSQFYKQHVSYIFSDNPTEMPNVTNLLDIAQYYISNVEVTVPSFVINIATQNLHEIAQLGESVLVLTGAKEKSLEIKKPPEKEKTEKGLLDYLKKIQLLVEGFQIVSAKSLPDLYISNSITFKFSLNIPIKCRNLILAQKVKIEGIRFLSRQLQVMGGI